MNGLLTEDEVAARLPVWEALSELFLDNDIAASVPSIAQRIAVTDFTLAEVETMLRWDVRPAFYGNLLSVAGQWSGWRSEDVRERVLATRGRRRHRLVLGRNRLMPTEWNDVARAIDRIRTASG